MASTDQIVPVWMTSWVVVTPDTSTTGYPSSPLASAIPPAATAPTIPVPSEPAALSAASSRRAT